MRKWFRILSTVFLLAILLSCAVPARAISRHLRVGVNANLPPFQFIDSSGQCAGVHIDIINAIAKQRKSEVEFFLFDTTQECLQALDKGEVDLILGMIPSSNRLNETTYLYTDPLTSSQLCMITPNNLDGNITTAIFSSDTIDHALLSHLNVHQFIAVGGQTNVYSRHLEDPTTAMIGIKDSLIYQLQEDRVDNDYTVRHNYLGAIEFAMMMPSYDQELVRSMNESISLLKAGQQYENICSKWLPGPTREARLQRTLRIMGIAISVIATAVLGYIIVTRRIQKILRKQVALQTEQIRKANEDLTKQFSELQDEYELRNRIIKSSPSGMVLIDLDYTITLINHSACAIAGVTEAVMGQSALELPVFRDILNKEGPSVFQDGVGVKNSILRLGDTPLRMRSYSYMINQSVRYNGIEGVLITVQDITESDRRQQEKFEQEKNSVLTRIAAGIAHEIRNPLMAIRTFASLIGTKGDNAQVQDAFSKHVPEEVDRIDRLIDNFIHYAKPSNRTPQQVRVDTIVTDSLALVRPILRKNKFHLEERTAEGLYIFADRDQIKQVLTNILLNGIDAMAAKGSDPDRQAPLTLSVLVEGDSDQVRIIIRDEGIGMDQAALDICTEPFFSTKETGTGLGLALCRQYIKENNGTMEIESKQAEYTQICLSFERSNL